MFRATKSVEPPPGMQLNIRVVGVHWSSAYTGVVGKKVPPDAAMSHSLNRALTAQHTGACIHRRCLATASLATRSTSLLAWSPTDGLTGCVQLSDSARVAFSTTAIWGSDTTAVPSRPRANEGLMEKHVIVLSGTPMPTLSPVRACYYF